MERFVFTPVLAGKYTVTVEMKGFKKYTQSGITLDVSDKLGLPPLPSRSARPGNRLPSKPPLSNFRR